jgi:hypothetical protein
MHHLFPQKEERGKRDDSIYAKGWEWRTVDYFKRAVLLASSQLSSE